MDNLPSNPSDHGCDVPLPDLLDLLRLCVTTADAVIPQLRFSTRSRTHVFAVALLAQVVDYARGVIVAGTSGTYALIPGGVRSAFYAYADIVNLCEDMNYWKALELADAGSWSAVLQGASQGKNPFLKGISESDLLQPGRSHYAKLRKTLEKEGVQRPEIKDRFEKAGMTNEYNSAYGFLSADTHNNVSAVVSRHFVVTDDGVRLRRAEDEKPSVYELPGTLIMSEMLLRSMEKLLRHCGHGIAVLAEADERFRAIAAVVAGRCCGGSARHGLSGYLCCK